jgi:galactose mutarotase-like enzyme
MPPSGSAGRGRFTSRGPWSAIELATDEVAVAVLPEKGCDILELVDRRSGVDLLFKSPWGHGRRPVHAPSSFEAWIESYPGGWQVLLPNGGDAAVENGVEWGFHGEAGLIEWRVDELSPDAATFSTSLITAPLELVRRLNLSQNMLRVEEQVTNRGGDAIEVMWGHHPTFGAPFLEPGCMIETSARTFTADDRAPGGLEPGRRSSWPTAVLADGGQIDLSALPAPDEHRAVLGYLSDFEDGSYRIANPRLRLTVEIRWPLDLFPHAWFWQELHASPGYPWYRRAYTTAIEPNTTIPAQGIVNARAKGGIPLRLEPNASRVATLQAALTHS